MRWLVALALVAFTCFAALQATAFFTTFAELPETVPLRSYEPNTVAAALGHAKQVGAESMRNFLGSSFLWLTSAALINLIVAVYVVLVPRRGP